MSDKKKIFQWWAGSATTSAFSDVWGWWRADTYTGSSPNIVLTDKSTNGRNMTQQAGTLTPGTAANGKAKMTGGATARLLSSGTLNSWPVTIITVGKRAAGATCGFFGHTGGASFNTLWAGFESSNNHYLYATNASINNDLLYGTDQCWVARIGYGSRVTIINGIIQSDQTLASIVRSGSIAVELGTSYRGLNFDWYETLVWDRTLTLAELDEVHTYINTRYGMSIPLWSSYTTTPTIWIGGQSNADGRGDRGVADVNIPVEYRGAQTNVNMWEYNPTNTFVTHDPTLKTPAPYISLYFGPDTSLGKNYIDRVGGSVYLFKYTLGSTGLYRTAALAAGNGYWDPLANNEVHSHTTRQYAVSVKYWWNHLRVHQQASRKPNIVGFVWFQGEQDAIDATAASAYSGLIQSMVPLLRGECGCGNGKFLLTRIHSDIDIVQHPYRDTVRSQQEAAASLISNCTLVSIDSYTLRDTAHINAAGQIAYGEACSDLL